MKKCILILLVAVAGIAGAQNKDSIILRNKFLERKFLIGSNGFYTGSFKNLLTDKAEDYIRKGSAEFYFTINKGTVVRDVDHSFFSFVSKDLKRTADGVQQLIVILQGNKGSEAENLKLELNYWVYDELPVIRKQIKITNIGSDLIAITNLDIERLNLVPKHTQFTDIISNYGTHLTWRPYKGGYHDPAVYVYHVSDKEGFILGNEAPSVLKRTEVYTHPDRISIGLTKIDDHYPFKKWLEAGQVFKSPKVFICLTKADKWEDAFESHFADFVRTRMGVKLFGRKEVPFTFYNTWFPFRSRISDTLLYKVADGLAGTNTDLLIIDDGWQNKLGDWDIDRKKFPDGLKPVCDYIIKKGMKPGLWLGLASVSADSKVYKEHPEWAVLDKNGKPTYLHTGSKEKFTMSLGSGYYDYILKRLRDLIKENNLAYLKLDFAIANSAYVLDYEKKGDYGTQNKTYRDRESSYYAIYERALKLFDELHETFPDLLIDCTYEVWGEYYINDFALIQHADYDWLTNYEANPPEGPINIRQMAYDRGRVIPPATNLIGNQQMYTTGANTAVTTHYKYTYLSLASSKPILVGDPRSLPEDAKEWYAKWNTWFKMMDQKYQFTRFTQVSDVFPRPTMTNWDGCYKFNKEKQGGVLFFYRNGSLESKRTFSMPIVNASAKYHLYNAENGKTFAKISGKELLLKGITITIPNTYQATVLGIEKIN